MNNSDCQDKLENITIKKIGHQVQTDFAFSSAWELCVLHGVIPKSFTAEAYQLHISLMLNFLDKIDSLRADQKPVYFNAKNEKARVSKMTSNWLIYDRKVNE